MESDIDRIVNALRKVPEKRLLIIGLANSITVIDGHFDYDEVQNIKPEVNLAVAEAKMYGAQTLVAVDSLKKLIKRTNGNDV